MPIYKVTVHSTERVYVEAGSADEAGTIASNNDAAGVYRIVWDGSELTEFEIDVEHISKSGLPEQLIDAFMNEAGNWSLVR
jgi:hypothetical protein